jgi:aminotransferase EvaB
VTVPVAAPTRMALEESEAVRRAVAQVIAGPSWILGEPVRMFEAAFAAYVGTEPALTVGVGNGTDALVLAMAALRLPVGSGVLVAADEGGYAATAARMAGLEPVAIDVGPLGPTAETAAAGMCPGVSALVVTHLHGDAVPLTELDRWRRHRGLSMIEDCAQAHGLRVDGRHVGLTGDAATYSFYPTKNLGAVGDAGAVLFADPASADRGRALRQYGWGDRFALTDERDQLAAGLAARGVETAVHYPWLVTEMPGLRMAPATTPCAAQRRGRILSLPCFPELTDDEVDQVCGALEEVVCR